MKLSPPYPEIRSAFKKGRVIPLLGAGASFGARNPGQIPWRSPASDPGVDWGPVSYLPTASELAHYLAWQSAYPREEKESVELTKASQYFYDVVGGTPLYDALHEIFTFKQEPTPLHQYLAEVAKSAALLIVTTNYDDLIERAFQAAGQPCDVVIHVTSPAHAGEILWRPHGQEPQEMLAKDLMIDLATVSVIYKMHGAIDRQGGQRGQYVITEDDYIDFLTRMTRDTAIPKIFAEPLQTRPFLFLGYGLYDWNLRVVLNRIQKQLRRPNIQSWAIEPRPKPLEKALWGKRNVQVFDDLTIDEFVEKLWGRPKPVGPSAAKAADVTGAPGTDA